MDSFSAIANGERNRGKPLMVFDWDKAAKIIKDSKCDFAEAGLSGDWEWTGGVIFEDGKPCDKENTYTYLASTWATPELEVDGDTVPCWKYQDQTPDWGAETFWPETAIAILNT